MGDDDTIPKDEFNTGTRIVEDGIDRAGDEDAEREGSVIEFLSVFGLAKGKNDSMIREQRKARLRKRPRYPHSAKMPRYSLCGLVMCWFHRSARYSPSRLASGKWICQLPAP